MTRAAIYARYSSENQHEASIDDQVRNASKLIEGHGWRLAETYSDHAISGATTLRPGFQALLADARSEKFDVVVAEGLDRLSRDQETIAGLYKQLTFLGIAIVTHSEGEVNELHVGVKGAMNSIFLKDLAIKTRRGLEGRVRKGRSAGGKAYGYDVVKPENDDDRGRLAINKAEAAIIVRIYEAFAAGKSPKGIAREMNEEGIPGPTGRHWRDTTLRGHATRRTGILRNDLYAGRRVWNKQTYVHDPMTNKRLARPNPPEEWIIDDVPELRIVDQDLWEAVQARLDGIRNSITSKNIRKTEFWKARRKKHLLTGLVHCGECGGQMSAAGRDYLACSAARNDAGCTNRRSVKRPKIEAAILDGLRHRLMAPELVEEFIAAFHAEINKQSHQLELAHEQKQRQLSETERKLNGLYDAIADGMRTPGLKDRLLELEAKKAELEHEIATGIEPQPRLHPNLARLYREKVENLHAALSDPEARTEAAEVLAGLVERIDVKTDGKGHTVELTGDIVKLITLPDGQSVPDAFESSVKVVAGVGFEPTTFRL